MDPNLIELEVRHADGRKWPLRVASVRFDDWIEVEALTNNKIKGGHLISEVADLNMLARKALYWLARRHNGDGARWDSDEINAQCGDITIADVTPWVGSDEDGEQEQDPPEEVDGPPHSENP